VSEYVVIDNNILDVLNLQDQGRIHDFKLGGGALKKIAPSGGRHENCWSIPQSVPTLPFTKKSSKV
jgi:hypothetical protein